MKSSSPAPSLRLIYALLGLVTLAAYAPVLQNSFIVYDDPDYVTANHHVLRGLTWESIRWAFSSTYYSNWFPLTWLSHMFDVQLFGQRAWAHHLMNVLYHAGSTLLLFHVLRRMTGATWRSACVAAFFAWHPLRVESVAWASERKDVLSALFWMLTLLAYLRYTERRSAGRYLTTLLTFALGLMAKPMLVTLPFVLLLLDFWPLNRMGWASPEGKDPQLAGLASWLRAGGRLVWEKLPFFALTAASCLITMYAQKKGYSVAPIDYLSLPARVTNAVVGYAWYIAKMLWPLNLAVFYPLPASQPLGTVALSVVALGGISAWALRRLRTHPYLLVGWLWYLGTLVPVIGLVQVGDQAVADRYSYIPMIGLNLMATWFIGWLMDRHQGWRVTLATAGTAALALCVVLTGIQAARWKDSRTLFTHTLTVTTGNHVAMNVLGAELLNDGKPAEARELFLQSMALRPNDGGAQYCLGNSYAKEGRYDEAIAAYREALRLSQSNPQEIHNALGAALLAKGQIDQAIEQFSESARRDPNFLEPVFNRAIAWNRQGKLEEAKAGYLEVLKMSPNHPRTLLHLGNLLVTQGKTAEALPVFERLLHATPDSASALNRLAWILATHPDAKVRNGPEAVRLATRACKLTGHNQPQSLNSLAAAYAETGRFPEAVATAQKAAFLAQSGGQTGLVAIIQDLLKRYEAGTPYRESATGK